MVGEEVILNCSVDSRDPASDIEEVSWKRTDQDILVLLYQDSEVLSDSSHDNYRGRVEFFITEIPKGNFSLKLKDVRLEDKGEFLCEVHTRNLSARTTVVLQRLGFSGFHIWILVLCFCVVLISVGLGVLIFILQRKEDSSGGVVKLHASLIICPNILMCAAFIAWSTEGTLAEIVTCSVVSIIRPLMLVKTSPYLRRFPSLCCAVVVAVLASVFGALCVHYVNEHMGNKKDGKGYMALTALLHVSAATSLFKHPDDLPNIPHCVIYIFGAVGLNTVNSIALVLELCLKAGSGARTVEDLRVIVLPSETLFIAGWLVLQIYGVCVAIRHRRKGGQGRTVCQVHQEMEGLSDTVL
ncbi:uncharacterized protein [Salminus brasiliensis]|uniref:uncharacterized protein isoform X1 n=1 Tax=Salminus brasiliensis TaxID=930266 RepID=UPI003B8322EA